MPPKLVGLATEQSIFHQKIQTTHIAPTIGFAIDATALTATRKSLLVLQRGILMVDFLVCLIFGMCAVLSITLSIYVAILAWVWIFIMAGMVFILAVIIVLLEAFRK